MANQKIFCNVPWTNVHLYWDGSFGMCCSEKNKIYENKLDFTYNIRKMTINEWFNSKPMKDARVDILGDSKLTSCAGCYSEEISGFESRRARENFKSNIFTLTRFDKSFAQSKWNSRFLSALDRQDQASPIDWHIDLGNECNLCCKMCGPAASSLMASKYKKWNIEFTPVKNWVHDELAWQNFLLSIDNTPNLNRLHFMGGEPMLNKRLYQIIDYLLEKKKTDINISFVTNGTFYDDNFYDKLLKFKSCDIEVSIESVNNTNLYIRQPGIDSTLPNIKKLITKQSDKFHIVLRSVPQLLNVNDYHEYILFAWDNKISIQSIPLTRPAYLAIKVLPKNIRQGFKENYLRVKNKILEESKNEINALVTGRDPSRLHIQLVKECDGILAMLDDEVPMNIAELEKELSLWLSRWDKEFKLNAYNFYPEYADFFQKINYEPGIN